MRRLVELVVRRLEVEGTSMSPTYRPGERLTAVRRWRPVRPGDVVAVRDPREPTRWLLKRCVARSAGLVELRGDNADASTDSRQFGAVPVRSVRWIVIAARPGPASGREEG